MNIRVLTNTWVEKNGPYYEAVLGPLLDRRGMDLLRVLLADVFLRGLVLGHEAETLEIEEG